MTPPPSRAPDRGITARDRYRLARVHHIPRRFALHWAMTGGTLKAWRAGRIAVWIECRPCKPWESV